MSRGNRAPSALDARRPLRYSRRALVVIAPLVLASTGCGGGSSAEANRTHDPAALRSCLEQVGASVADNDPAYLGDPTQDTFQVGLGGGYADVVVGADNDEAKRLAEGGFASLSDPIIDGNVAYWKLDETDDPVDAISNCLE